MVVGIFLNTTGPKGGKRDFMLSFAEGLKKFGEEVIIVNDYKYQRCDLALIFGFYGPNLGKVQKFRKQIFDAHTITRRKNCLFLDADLLRFAGEIKAITAEDPTQHIRVSHKSIFPDEANYFNEDSPPDRWKLLCERKKITVVPYRKKGEHILLCLNSDAEAGHGWSARNVDIMSWALTTIERIRAITDRPIRVRFHPNAKEEVQRTLPWKKMARYGDVTFSGGIIADTPLVIKENKNLEDDCKRAWAAVVYNTSASVIPIINGIPIFTSQRNCIAYPIANHNLRELESPKLYPREQWFYDLAYSCWNMEEMKSGLVWSRFKARLNNKGDVSKEKSSKLKK